MKSSKPVSPVETPEVPQVPSFPVLTLPEIVKTMKEGSVPFYEACYRILEYDPGTEAKVEQALGRIMGSVCWKDYVQLEKVRGIPALMTGLIHNMECGNDPKGCLHNGERIIGTGRKTTIVPKGRGPFQSFMESALDATNDEFWKVPEWSLGWMLYRCERFNGTGYISGACKAEISPYIWACSNINDGLGKYTSDGVCDPNAPSNGQVGCGTLLKRAEQLGIYKPRFSA